VADLVKFFNDGYYNTSLGMTLGVYPVLVFVISLVLQLILKKKVVILLICFFAWFIATLFIFEASFLKWCFIYTFISLLGTLVGDLELAKIKEITNRKI
jgi:hypothetical protein